jgi:hypothetical protein
MARHLLSVLISHVLISHRWYGPKDPTGAAAVLTALESAVQLGRGDKVNRQAKTAILTKCRDFLQQLRPEELSNCLSVWT